MTDTPTPNDRLLELLEVVAIQIEWLRDVSRRPESHRADNLHSADYLERLVAEVESLRAENTRLRARPCPWVETSDGGTSHCTLAAATGAGPAPTGDHP